MCGRRVAASMPQTPSFFTRRGLTLYNLLVGQRFSLRFGAASATQPVGRSKEGTIVVLALIALSLATTVLLTVLVVTAVLSGRRERERFIEKLAQYSCPLCGRPVGREAASKCHEADIIFRWTGPGPAPRIWQFVCPGCNQTVGVADQGGELWHWPHERPRQGVSFPNRNPGAKRWTTSRCPSCNERLNSDYAKQCLLCGADWHDANAQQ